MGAGAWTLSVVFFFFVVQAIAQAASARPYNPTTNLISHRGTSACSAVVCSPLHNLVDGTFAVVGLLHWIGAAMIWRSWPGWPSKSSLTLLALAGWGLIVAGLFPENVAPDTHRIAAVIGLISLNVSMILLGSALVGSAKAMGILAIEAGVLGLVSFVVFLSQPSGAIGVWERLADYPGAAMVVLLGALILLRALLNRHRDVAGRV